MDNPFISELSYDLFSKVQLILDNPQTMQSFLEVLPPDCSSEDVRTSMNIEGNKYCMTPAKYLLLFLGSKYRVSNLIRWLEAINLEKALIHLKQPEPLRILEHPQAIVKVKEGEKLSLACRAASYPPPEYQWLKDKQSLLLQVEPVLCINCVSTSDSGIYICFVMKWNAKNNSYDCLRSNLSCVEVIPSCNAKWKNEFTACSKNHQIRSSAAGFELQKIHDPRNTEIFYATEKIALLIANDAYNDLEKLDTPAADVTILAKLLSEMNFKVLPFRNLALAEMRNVFRVFCEKLKPGSYAVFSFSGHGFDMNGQTYLQPVDCSENPCHEESVCAEYLLKCMQETEPAMNFFILDTCRKLPDKMSDAPKEGDIYRDGVIFEAIMAGNTIYAYSTCFLCAAHESYLEENSIFIKYLTKYLTNDICIQTVLLRVQADFAKDPLTKNIQFPVIKTSLAEPRKLTDGFSDPSNVDTSLISLQLSNIKRSFKLSNMGIIIVAEFHLHRKVFCNGFDVFLDLDFEPNKGSNQTTSCILRDLQINFIFNTNVLNVYPSSGVNIKNILDMRMKKKHCFEIHNLHKIQGPVLEGELLLEFCKFKIVTRKQFYIDVSKIFELQLSINQLGLSDSESCNCSTSQA